MAFLDSMRVVGSGLTAQKLRLDVVSENITNMNTTRTEEGGAYRRKIVTFEAQEGQTTFEAAMAQAKGTTPTGGGVKVTGIIEDQSDFKLVYDPTHPDANEEGYLEMPNVDLIKEMADAMAASQAFSANTTAFNTLRSVAARGLEIGK